MYFKRVKVVGMWVAVDLMTNITARLPDLA